MKESFREKLPRIPLLILGLVILAFGIALSTKSGLGVDPGSSFVYLLGEVTPLSMGTFTVMMHCLYILIQVVLLRKEFHPSRLLQLAAAFAFSYFLDFAMKLVAPIQVHGYLPRLGICILSCAIMGLGVYLEINANVIVMASEGALSTIAAKTKKDFGLIKIFNDLTSVALSLILSLAVYHEIRAIREGTVIAAVLVGLFTQLYARIIHIKGFEPKVSAIPVMDYETQLKHDYPDKVYR